MAPGLSRPARECLERLETARARLYVIFANLVGLTILFSLVVASVYSMEAVEPRLPRWLSGTMELILPGAPTHVLGFAERHPLAVLSVVLVFWLLRRASKRTKEAAQEYAFQEWRRAVGSGSSPTASLSPISGSHWVPPSIVTVFFMVGIIVYVGINTLSHQGKMFDANDVGDVSCSDGVRGDCWLVSGETVLVSVNSRVPRNETGVLLEKNSCYVAEIVGRTAWRNGKVIEPASTGFEFDSDMFGLPEFWWLRWLRPSRKAQWFEVVGRIGRQPTVFPVLEFSATAGQRRFTAPAEGELVLQVNDVAYENNGGVMRIALSRCNDGGL